MPEEDGRDSEKINPAGSFFRLNGVLVTAAGFACKLSTAGGNFLSSSVTTKRREVTGLGI